MSTLKKLVVVLGAVAVLVTAAAGPLTAERADAQGVISTSPQR